MLVAEAKLAGGPEGFRIQPDYQIDEDLQMESSWNVLSVFHDSPFARL